MKGAELSGRESSDLFRSVNERILELGWSGSGSVELICECPDQECMHVLRMTIEEHAAMRSEPGLYAVVPGHEQRWLAEAVDRSDRYVVLRMPLAATTPQLAA
jgi:hypothetical protein